MSSPKNKISVHYICVKILFREYIIAYSLCSFVVIEKNYNLISSRNENDDLFENGVSVRQRKVYNFIFFKGGMSFNRGKGKIPLNLKIVFFFSYIMVLISRNIKIKNTMRSTTRSVYCYFRSFLYQFHNSKVQKNLP